MIGGGDYVSFLNGAVIDEELIVRSAQCHALMPMMQFSVAPWRVLNAAHLTAVLDAVKLREKFKDYILATTKQSAVTGEPILRSMEYAYSKNGYATIRDQFLIGDSLLVAPVVEKGIVKRMVAIPKGSWKNATGNIIKGPKIIEMNADISTLLYFVKVK